MEELETSTNNGESSTKPDLRNPKNGGNITFNDSDIFSDEIDSACSTPYVSAPSSPGRGSGGFFYSAPASPMHFILSNSTVSSSSKSSKTEAATMSTSSNSFEFEFSARYEAKGPVSSADELFLNGQIRPMKLSSHLQRPQVLAPLLDLDENNDEDYIETGEGSDKIVRGRDLRLRDRSLRRRTRSMSPLRSSPFQWQEVEVEDIDEGRKSTEVNEELQPSEEAVESDAIPSASSSRSSSVGRNSKRWVFLKEFLYRSKSEGRNSTGHKFWSSLSFSPIKDKKMSTSSSDSVAPKEKASPAPEIAPAAKQGGGEQRRKKAANGLGKRRVALSPHELHYTANRAQAEEMKKKTFLPYRQGVLGCLGFSSKSYGAMNGFARALNPVSSR
ncbi:hypothetical protein LguiA_026652 [Lonicera macranthoides]